MQRDVLRDAARLNFAPFADAAASALNNLKRAGDTDDICGAQGRGHSGVELSKRFISLFDGQCQNAGAQFRVDVGYGRNAIE